VSVYGTITAAELRRALENTGIDLASADDQLVIDLEVEPDVSSGSWDCLEDEQPQHDDYELDDFMSAAIGGDRLTAAALAHRLFTDSNLDLVERHLVRH